ncbi:MAG: M23 family metallopeptidase [Pseudomonadota bacterium]|nr:M23 family metallopeptidase [Sphingomonas sp.]MDQ3483727.1 M23 family metallopeptidase [Pseudomonadota bacterium]
MPATTPATEESARAALARARARYVPAGPSGDSFTLVVDLAAEPVGSLWLRGVATLALLCGSALALAPGIDLASSAHASAPIHSDQFRMNQMLSGGELVGAEDLRGEPLPVSKPVIASDSSAIRVQGPVTDGLYWSLRSAGVTSEVAAAYLAALSTRLDVGSEVAPYDRFDLVFSKDVQGEPQLLLYAALHRVDGRDVELMRWNVRGRSDWFDSDLSGDQASAGLMAPVAGRITSGFGVRHHPILRFARFHGGIDFGAPSGSPIVAATDGIVVGAGWNGGYGRQVRVAHEGGIVTTYSHMSSMAASPGETVRQGQVIGHVGSTGLSTGPHLHFEVKVNGRAVDPMQVRLQARKTISDSQKQAFDARLRQLLSIGTKTAQLSS